MVKSLFMLLLLTSLSQKPEAQYLKEADSLRYRINLPPYWKPGHKAWQILSDKLPLVCPELQDKMLCGDDCFPYYHVEMILTRPEIIDYNTAHLNTNNNSQSWEIQTMYSFECSLLLMNKENHVLTKIILVDTSEVWRVNHMAQLAAYVPVKPIRYITTGRNPQPVAVQNPVPAILPETPFDWINRHQEELMPELKDLFAVVDNKIRSL